MDTLALTDRDGTYGAVRFAKACLQGRDPAGARRRPRRRPAAPLVGRARPDRAAGRRRPHPGRAAARSATRRLPRVTFLASGRRRLGGAVPAGLGDPPGRRARRPGRAPSTWSPSTSPGSDVLVLLGPASELGPGGDAAPRRPRPGPRSRRWLRGGRPRPTSSSSWSPTGCAGGPGPGSLAARRPDGRARPVGRARRGAHQRGPLRRPARRPDRRRARRRPPAGRRSTCATSTAATPRGSSSPASRCRGGRGDLPARRARRQRPRGPAAARPHPRGRRPVRPRPARRPRPGRGALPGVRAVTGPSGGRAAAPARTGRRAAAGPLRGRRSAAATARAPRQRIWKRLDDELRDDPRRSATRRTSSPSATSPT